MNIGFRMVFLKTGEKYEVNQGTTRWIVGVDAGVRIGSGDGILFIPWHAVREGYEL